jgi:hypothetical protein
VSIGGDRIQVERHGALLHLFSLFTTAPGPRLPGTGWRRPIDELFLRRAPVRQAELRALGCLV